MRHALIERATHRLCQVEWLPFEVHADLEWRTCADGVTPETHYFDGTQFLLKPTDPPIDPAVATRLETDAEELLQAKLDAAVMSLVNATPGQLVTYARNNFPSLTLAEQNRLGAILFALAVAVRPQVR